MAKASHHRSFSPPPPRPTDGELAILGALWEAGPSTVRQVHQRLGRDIAYTTILKLLQIMTVKGLVERDESSKTHIYRAAQPAAQTQRHMLKDLLDRAFAGSAANLVMQALAAKRATPEELAEIRKLVNEYQQKEEQP
jgi:BlaI family transcriptional regulator, penicillinase repressor